MLAGCVPWPQPLERAYLESGVWAGETLPAALDRMARQAPARTFLACGAECLGYAQTSRRTMHVAARFHGLGLRPRDIVLLQLPNSIEFVVAFFALLRIGVVPVLCLPAHGQAELRAFAGLTGARGYLFPTGYRDRDYVARARELQSDTPGLRYLIAGGEARQEGITDLGAWLRAPLEDAPAERPLARVDPCDVAFMLLSGGTTGVPKLIPRTHADYLYNARQCARALHWDAQTVYLAALPAAHNFALGAPGLVAVMTAGGRVALSASTAAEEVIGAIDRHRATFLPATPALLMRVLEAHESGCGELGSLRQVCVGGQRMLPELFDRLCRVLPRVEPLQVYGMAEGLTNLSRPEDPLEVRRHTQGRPVSALDEVRIVDEAGAEVPEGGIGELLTRGPYTIRGYYRAAEHNGRAFTADGYYRTGDLVRRDRGGNFTVEGRNKDIINRGGEKIGAEEIENLILAHEDVRMSAVVAMPDPEMGERCCAFVVLRAGATLTLEALNAFLAARRIARFKLPERLEVVQALPLTAMGKVSKASLRERIAAQLRGAGAAARGAGTAADGADPGAAAAPPDHAR
ncbi:MAG: AMP-binding protein [Burkholderiales bacterium]|nr:AMP-binding protein [Burkholderiales bacterium]